MELPIEIESKILELIGMPDFNNNSLTYKKRLEEIRIQMHKLTDDFARSRPTEDTYRDAYFAYNFPVNLMKVRYVLNRLKFLYPNIFDEQCLDILDVGCGEGAGMFGLYYGLKDLSPSMRYSLNGVDISRHMLKKCASLMAWLRRHNPNITAKLINQNASPAIFKKTTEKYHTILFVNSLIEIFKDEEIPLKFIESAMRSLNENGSLIIIEPALKKIARRLMTLRHGIIKEKKAHVLAPCLHDQQCPIFEIKKEWCHESIPWNPPSFLDCLNQGLNREIDYLKFSWLAISQKDYARKQDKEFLVISRLLMEKGKQKCFLCTPSGRVELTRLNKFKSPTNAEFNNIKKGNIISLNNIQQTKPQYWQITKDSQVKITK